MQYMIFKIRTGALLALSAGMLFGGNANASTVDACVEDPDDPNCEICSASEECLSRWCGNEVEIICS